MTSSVQLAAASFEALHAGQTTEARLAALAAADLAVRASPPVDRSIPSDPWAPRTVSLVMPVFQPDPEHVREAIASVRLQTFEEWQLVVVPDGPQPRAVLRSIIEGAGGDDRVVVLPAGQQGGISAATNRGLARVTSTWVTFLDQDDVLTPHALAAAMEAVAAEPSAGVVYLDEAKLEDSGAVVDVTAKPAWSPEYLRCCMYLGHLVHYRTALVDAVGGLRTACDGSQDWDLALRVSELRPRVVHVPKVGYLWRRHDASTSTAVAVKSWTVEAAARAIADHVAVDGCEHVPEPSPVLGWFRTRRRLRRHPLVTVVLPTAGTPGRTAAGGVNLAASALDGLLRRTDWEQLEVVCVLGGRSADAARDVLRPVADERVRFLELPPPFNFATAVNRGALAGTGDVVLLFNDDVEVVDDDWLARMVEHAVHPEVGAVGAVLRYPDGRLQHAGVHFSGSGPDHVAARMPYGPGHNGSLVLDTVHLAVTGAVLGTRRDVFERVGGFQPTFALDYNDIDYCLKVGRMGLRCVVAGGAVLVHHESATRPVDMVQAAAQTERLYALWPATRRKDPFHPPLLDRQEDLEAFVRWFRS